MAERPLPLLDHDLDAPSLLTPEALMDVVRTDRAVGQQPIPALCVLEFDGDLIDWLVRDGRARPHPGWACFHTTLYVTECAGVPVGVIGRTIGGPYAVLVAEQLHAAGARLVVGLTSAGRVLPDLPLPCLVVADRAVRDEGTSLHYLPPAETVACPSPTPCLDLLARELSATGITVHTGCVWTTDAPYRETASQIDRWAQAGILAVEMQAASLFAYGQARQAHVAIVAIVSNGPGHAGPQFDTGGHTLGIAALEAITRAATAFFASGPY
jgi:uridine phosphorylase